MAKRYCLPVTQLALVHQILVLPIYSLINEYENQLMSKVLMDNIKYYSK